MKKILSLVMVVAMLLAVLAFVGCNNTTTTESSSSSISSNTTSGTTAGSTTESTTASTTESTTASTSASTSASTTTESTTASTESTTTLPPVFARFDFGTATKAEQLGMTSHDYLTRMLTYDANFIEVSYTEDAIVVKALQDHPEIKFYTDEDGDLMEDNKDEAGNARYSSTSYALLFEDLDLYTFNDHLTKDQKFMKIRILNNTVNNIIAFSFHDTARGYATTMHASNMYLQGGVPNVEDYKNGEARLTAEPSTEYKSYIYDINLVAALCRSGTRTADQAFCQSYAHYIYHIGLGNGTGSNNWNWMGTAECNALRFFVLGAYGNHPYREFYNFSDTRKYIVKDATVEIDYILFANAKADFNSYTSIIEDAYISSSVSESISISESISASEAANTTAAA